MAIDNKILRVGIYVRVSRQEQVIEGVSIEAQVAALRAYAKSQGWEIADEYIDGGVFGDNSFDGGRVGNIESIYGRIRIGGGEHIFEDIAFFDVPHRRDDIVAGFGRPDRSQQPEPARTSSYQDR